MRMRRVRFLDRLDDDLWRSPAAGVDDVFFPALRGLPDDHALLLALLPIHDANELLLQALAEASPCPQHVWVCVVANDPFRANTVLLDALHRHSVARVCCLPVSALYDEATNRMLDASGLGRAAEESFEALARQRGFRVRSIASAIKRGRP